MGQNLVVRVVACSWPSKDTPDPYLITLSRVLITLPPSNYYAHLPMSTYTPCFPPSIPKPDRTRLLSSTSGSSSSDNAPKVSFSARLSRAHLALASVSDHVRRPPSPTSAAIDLNRVGRLRRKFRLAVAAAYRDTSGGKWAHVSEMARLGCTIGRWQGVCSGNKAPHTLCPPSTGDRNEQGEWLK